jgi:hypothetical protein
VFLAVCCVVVLAGLTYTVTRGSAARAAQHPAGAAADLASSLQTLADAYLQLSSAAIMDTSDSGRIAGDDAGAQAAAEAARNTFPAAQLRGRRLAAAMVLPEQATLPSIVAAAAQSAQGERQDHLAHCWKFVAMRQSPDRNTLPMQSMMRCGSNQHQTATTALPVHHSAWRLKDRTHSH